MKPGDIFRAKQSVGSARADRIGATFVVTAILPSGLILANGTCDDRTDRDRNFKGTRERKAVRFKRGSEFQPNIPPGWVIDKEDQARQLVEELRDLTERFKRLGLADHAADVAAITGHMNLMQNQLGAFARE